MKAIGYTLLIIGSLLIGVGTNNKKLLISLIGLVLVILGVNFINGNPTVE